MGWAQGRTKEENGGHILGVRPSLHICERQNALVGGCCFTGCCSSHCLLNPVKHFPEPGLPGSPRPLTACQLAAKAEPGVLGDGGWCSAPLSGVSLPHPPPQQPVPGRPVQIPRQSLGPIPNLVTPAGIHLPQTGIPCPPTHSLAAKMPH